MAIDRELDCVVSPVFYDKGGIVNRRVRLGFERELEWIGTGGLCVENISTLVFVIGTAFESAPREGGARIRSVCFINGFVKATWG